MAAINKYIFRKKWVVCLSAGPNILAFGSHSSENFQPFVDCFIPDFKIKYENSENVKADRVNTVLLRLVTHVGFFRKHDLIISEVF